MQKHPITTHKEMILSILILVILALISTGIYLAQFQYNPAIFPILPPLGPPVNGGKQDTLQKSLITLPEGITPMTPPESFGPENLSDKINGKAELYLSAGFLNLECQRFQLDTPPEIWVELFIYDMATPSNAFSVFSMQRREEAVSLDLTSYAYATTNALFLTHGKYYVEIIASAVSTTSHEPMKAIARQVIQENPLEKTDKAPEMAVQSLFPAAGLNPESISLIPANGFGYERLDQIFTAAYTINETEITAFLSSRKTANEAEALASGYAQFLLSFGGNERPLPEGLKNARVIEIMDTYEVIFTHGKFLAGVHQAETQKAAERLALLLYERLNTYGVQQ